MHRISSMYKLPIYLISGLEKTMTSKKKLNEPVWCCPLAVPEMSDPSKRKLYEILSSEGEKTVNDLTKRLKLMQPTVSYHLGVMKEKGIVDSRKEGREVYYFAKMLCHEDGACFS